ncbi:putative transcription factor [Podospora fimiseda]|uniref:Transcription factor n=1 Tax=Podospora fimiseda TaxID=252190 RepID=A0AAN7BQA5_9PEZI|nr:putative transcription factor [Podospora fimiseda]
MNPIHHHHPAQRNPYFSQQPPQQPPTQPQSQPHSGPGYHPQAHQSTPFGDLEGPSTPQTSASSNLSPETRLDPSPVRGRRKGSGAPPPQIWNFKPPKRTQNPSPAVSKARRVRTGCLTCRKRHLKCDEGTPDCSNCMKGNRTCERGLRLNFLDVTVRDPPFLVPQARDWTVSFQDESREIASEYRGGLKRYPSINEMGRGRAASTEMYAEAPRRSQSAMPVASSHTQEPLPQFFSTNNNFNSINNPRNILAQEPRDYATSVGQPPPPPPVQHPVTYDSGQLSLQNLLSHQDNDQYEDTPMANSEPPSAFTLAALQQPFTLKDEPPTYSLQQPERPRRNSQSSLTSSLVGEGTEQNSPSGGYANHPHDKLNPLRVSPDGLTTPSSDRTDSERNYLSTEDEIRYMQVFIDEVTIWMDTLNKEQHFANTLPYLALKSPMLLNACLACGVKRLCPTDEKAGVYYDTATTQMMRSLQNPDRNTAESAITAVVLNVYETMMDTPAQRIHHISGARALIRECGWDATSTGIASSCFWLNVGLEVLTCLSQNWKTAWDPDDWGMDLEFTTWIVGSHAGSVVGSETTQEAAAAAKQADSLVATEELWTQRIFYIMAKVVNFRATIPKFQEPSPHDEQVRLQTRFAEWNRLKALLDAWNHNCPRSMQSFGYSLERSTKSVFPNIWLIKRTSTTARIFYQTCMTLHPQLNPMIVSSSSPSSLAEERESLLLARHHARQVCGMVAHTSDRGVASVAIRALAVAGAVLDDKREQEEVLSILQRIHNETGWKLTKVQDELKSIWERQEQVPGPGQIRRFAAAMSLPMKPGGGNGGEGYSGSGGPQVNPLLVNAEFGKEEAPYRGFWVSPNRQNEKEDKEKGKEKREEGNREMWKEREKDRGGESSSRSGGGGFGGLLRSLDSGSRGGEGGGQGPFPGFQGVNVGRDDGFGFGAHWPR